MNIDSHANAALHFFIMDTAKIFFLLFIIIYIMGLLRAMLSVDRLRPPHLRDIEWLFLTLKT